jgi:hypothetical protein
MLWWKKAQKQSVEEGEMIEIITTFAFHCPVNIDHMICSWNEADETRNEEHKRLYAWHGQAYYHYASD